MSVADTAPADAGTMVSVRAVHKVFGHGHEAVHVLKGWTSTSRAGRSP
nr:hypothetical protein GCM10025730_33130 [Promicromonospora thailandica]